MKLVYLFTKEISPSKIKFTIFPARYASQPKVYQSRKKFTKLWQNKGK